MRTRFARFVSLVFLCVIVFSVAGGGVINPLSTAQAMQGQGEAQPVVSEATRSDVSASLRHIPPLPPVLGEIFEARPRKLLPNRLDSSGDAGSDLVQDSSELSSASTVVNFEGINNVNGVLPPDTVGDVGPMIGAGNAWSPSNGTGC